MQRVAIGRRFRNRVGAYDGGCACPVVYHDGLAQRCGQFLCEGAGCQVNRPACWKGHYDFKGAVGEYCCGLRKGGAVTMPANSSAA